MESNSNSVPHNLQKLRKYEWKSQQVTDPSKAMVYGQKINFYKSNLKGAGVTSDALNVNAQVQPTQAETTVDELINNIDNLIQESRTAPQVQTGGSIPSITGHRIMTTGNRSQYVQQSQHGGDGDNGDNDDNEGDATDAAGAAAAAAAAAVAPAQLDIGQLLADADALIEKSVLANQAETVRVIEDQLDRIDMQSTAKANTIKHLNSEILRLQQECDAARTQYDADTAERDELSGELEAVRAEVEKFEGALAALRAEHDALVATNAELEEEKAELESAVAKLKEAEAALQDDLATARERIADLETKLAAARERCDVGDQEVAAKDADLERVAKKLRELMDAHRELSKTANIMSDQLTTIGERVTTVKGEQLPLDIDEGVVDRAVAGSTDDVEEIAKAYRLDEQEGGGRDGYTEIDNLLAMSVVDPTRFDFI